MEGTRLTTHGGAIALSALLALALAAAPAWAATIVVPNDFPTIKAAEAAASAGDTILIKKGFGPGPNGEYQEEDLIIDVKDLTLKCEKGAVLDGAIPSDAPGGPVDGINSDGIHIDADGVTVVGCTVQNFDGDGIDVDGDGATIINNTIVNNGVNGLNLDGDDFLVKNNRAIGNGQDGFRLEDSSNSNTLLRNTIVRNDGDGIDVDDDGILDTVIDGNRILRNRGTGIESDAGSETDIKNNVIKGNRTDIGGRGDDLMGCDPCVCANDPATDGGSNIFVTGGVGVCTPGTGNE